MDKAWNREARDVLAELGSDPERGLGGGEARRRRDEHGPNRLRQTRRRGAWAILVDQFKSLIFALLAAATVVSVAIGEIIQAAAILVAMLINVAIGFGTELKARRSMEALRELERDTARVRRDGEAREVDAGGIVPGDIVLLEAGEVVPADLRLIEASGLRVSEAALTGEAVPVAKTTGAIDGDPPLAERENMAWSGTSIANGTGAGVAVATGMETELGRISEMAESAERAQAPLEKRLDRLARRLLLVILVVAAAVAAIGILSGRDLVLMIETGVALVVAAVPEGLPIVASVALARGMWRLARRNALIEELSAVETLGATNVICSDKTGTLTENRMSVARFLLAEDEVRFGKKAAPDPDGSPALRAALEVAVLCNGASLDGEEGARGTGDPMEVALLAGGRDAGVVRDALLEEQEEVRREEFDPGTMMMATFHRTGDGVRVAVKGAPEAVVEAASRVMTGDGGTRDLDREGRTRWLERNGELTAKGLRALALAQKTVGDDGAEPYGDLVLIGLVGLEDPPREEVREAMLACREGGIRAVMVTGDQASTARAIAEAVGLVDDGAEARVVEGSDMRPAAELSADERKRLLDTPIFARVDPEQKLDLIELYQDAGLVVAMTGDGVNDAPALKKADIGVAMGRRGTEVARQAADMVLRDDSFASIVAAIRQGRTILGNIRKFVIYMLSGNAGEIFAVSVVALMNAPLPLLPLQILFINIVSDVFPALALGVGEGEGDEMKRPPRAPDEPLLTRRMWGAIAGYGVLIGGSALAVFAAAFALGMSTGEAVSVSFLTFGFARLLHIFNMRDAGTPFLRNGVTRNPYAWGAIALGAILMLAAVWVPGLNEVLEVEAPSTLGWGLIAAGSLIPLVVGQILKLPGLHRALWRPVDWLGAGQAKTSRSAS